MELSIKDLKDLFSQEQKTGFEDLKGKKVFIRTVTHHYTGYVERVDSMALTLSKAAWVADDGRFHDTMKDISNVSEVEPFINPVKIGLGAILDVTEICGELPTEQK